MNNSSQKPLSLSLIFAEVTKPDCRKKNKTTTVVSLRVTDDEKLYLQTMAGHLALGNFIRQQLLDNYVANRPTKHLKKKRAPKLSHVEVARILGMLGNSELARSMLALSLAAQAGELAMSPAIEEKIDGACDDIAEMRDLLIIALGVKPQESGQ